MMPVLGASSLGLRGRSTRSSSQEPDSSNASSRRHSTSSQSRKGSHASSQMDDWSDGFTGIVDLDRRMRELAIAEQGHIHPDGGAKFDVYESYSCASSWLEQEQQQKRRNSSSDPRSGSPSQSSLATGRSMHSLASNLHVGSSSSTTATSRFSLDSRAHSSLLAKRKSITTNTIESLDSTHSPLRLAPLPASSSAFGSYHLTDALPFSVSTRPSGTSSLPSWPDSDEQDLLTPLAVAARQNEPITPSTAAAATWTDPTAPGYFPAGLADDNKRKARSVRKRNIATRAPLPRLVSGEVVSSLPPVPDPSCDDSVLDKRDVLRLEVSSAFNGTSGGTAPSSTYALRRSAQSLALGLRFKMLRAKRKVKRTGQGAAELFASAGRVSQRNSTEAASLSA